MVIRIIFIIHLILVAKCVEKRKYSYILTDSEDSVSLQHDSKDLFLETNDIRKIVEDFFIVNNKSSKRFQIRDRPLKDCKESRALRKFASRRIVGGQQTSIRMHPYNVAISRQKEFWCGGSLIDEQWVLSAAHCMVLFHDGNTEKLVPFVVRAGSSFHYKGGYQARINKGYLSQLFFPDSYVPGNKDYDFCLLRLDRPLPISRNIAVVDLPSREYLIVPGDMLVVTGWGVTQKSGLGDVSPRLRYVLVPVVDSHSCQKSYSNLSPRMMCAGYTTGRKDSCNHDSGGPAIHDGVLAGVTSFGGSVCGDPEYPGVYGRVSEISDWVNYTVHHNEASAEPELREKIIKARIKEMELERTRKLLNDIDEEIKIWLHKIIASPIFLEKAKKKLMAAG